MSGGLYMILPKIIPEMQELLAINSTQINENTS